MRVSVTLLETRGERHRPWSEGWGKCAVIRSD
jgi:hypothetical protein